MTTLKASGNSLIIYKEAPGADTKSEQQKQKTNGGCKEETFKWIWIGHESGN